MNAFVDEFQHLQYPPRVTKVLGNKHILIYGHRSVRPTLREVIRYCDVGNDTEINRMILQNALSVNGVKLTSLTQREMQLDLTRPEGNKVTIGKTHEILIFVHDL